MKMNLLMTGGAVFACAALQAAPAFSNPSFEQGTSGYWINNASAARVEPGEASDGKQSLGIRAVPGKTVSVVQGLNYEANQYYKISFDAKGSDAELRLQIMLQGNKPLQFFSDPDLKKPFPLTDEFKRYSIELGPFPESIGSNPVRKLMIYFNVIGTVFFLVVLYGLNATITLSLLERRYGLWLHRQPALPVQHRLYPASPPL